MSLTSGVKLHVHLLNEVVRFIVFLTSATLIFRESLEIRDNESRLYYHINKLNDTENPIVTKDRQ